MDRCDLSVVVELETKNITGEADHRSRIEQWLRQMEQLRPRTAELLLCSPEAADLDALRFESSVPIRKLHCPERHYYGLKNAGAKAAAGDVVLFTDSDCRPGPQYLERLLRRFEDPRLQCLHGRTHYDGTGFLTRVNTVLSFGPLYEGAELRYPETPMTHNLSLRRSFYEADPFGPYNGRVGGDQYVRDRMRDLGQPIVLAPELLLYHEDPSFNLRGTLERHLREHFNNGWRLKPANRFSTRQTLRATAGSLWRRMQKLRRYRAAGRLGPLGLAGAAGLMSVYMALDFAAVLLILGLPSLKRRWFRYLYGEALAAELLS